MAKQTTPDFTSPHESTGPDAESLGSWLAQVRASLGAEQREAARRLGLNPTLIQALEADDFDRLGPPVFVRGYLTRYARLLDLPEQEVLARYQRQSSANQTPPPLKVVHPLRRQTRLRDLRGLFYLLLVVGIGWTAIQNITSLDPGRLFALWSSDKQDGGGPAPSTPITATSHVQYPFQSPAVEVTTASSIPPAAESPSISTSQPDSPTPGAANKPTATPDAPAAPAKPATIPATSGMVTATVTTTPAGPASTPAASGNNPSAEAKLLLEFSHDCWVEVKDAQGNVLANGVMKANSTHTLAGTAPFKVTLGNAPAARIILDDRLVNTEVYVPRRGTVSRFTLDRGQP